MKGRTDRGIGFWNGSLSDEQLLVNLQVANCLCDEGLEDSSSSYLHKQYSLL